MTKKPDELGGSREFIEKRGSPRMSFTASVHIYTATGTVLKGEARDISETGIGAIVFSVELPSRELPLDHAVEIMYVHPAPRGTELVIREAIVKGFEGNRYGFRFDSPLDVE